MANYFKVYKMDNRILKVYCPTDPYIYVILNNNLTYSDDFFVHSVTRCFEDFNLTYSDSYHPSINTRVEVDVKQSFDDYYFPRLLTYMDTENKNQLKMESLFRSITQLNFNSQTNFDMHVPIETSRRNRLLDWKDKTIGDIKGLTLKEFMTTTMYYDNTPYVGTVDLQADKFGVVNGNNMGITSIVDLNHFDTGVEFDNNSFVVCYVDFKDIGANLALDIDENLARTEVGIPSRMANKVEIEAKRRIETNLNINNSIGVDDVTNMISTIVSMDLDNKLNIGEEVVLSGTRRRLLSEILGATTIGQIKNKTIKELKDEEI